MDGMRGSGVDEHKKFGGWQFDLVCHGSFFGAVYLEDERLSVHQVVAQNCRQWYQYHAKTELQLDVFRSTKD